MAENIPPFRVLGAKSPKSLISHSPTQGTPSGASMALPFLQEIIRTRSWSRPRRSTPPVRRRRRRRSPACTASGSPPCSTCQHLHHAHSDRASRHSHASIIYCCWSPHIGIADHEHSGRGRGDADAMDRRRSITYHYSRRRLLGRLSSCPIPCRRRRRRRRASRANATRSRTRRGSRRR